ncbi:MAG TPA: PQQ-binding-like beta-propeller repeat protein [Candidatus Dormibacteraeota bacterium]
MAAALVVASLAAPLPVDAGARSSAQTPAAPIVANGSWTTYHHDNAHSGHDSSAPTAASVSPTPGWTQPVLDGEVYAEPLIYNGLVYVATLSNTVYALNQTDGSVVWSHNFGTPQASGWLCGNVAPMGILGTPVIDTTANRIYAAAEIADPTPANPPTYRLFGLDLTTGSQVLSTLIAPTGFDWKIQQERGALAIANGYVYVPFGGRLGDCFDGSTPYYGWVVGVPTDGVSASNVFQTPSGAESVWAAGGVVVDDTSHNVFFATGNAIPCSGASMSDSIVRVTPTLTTPTFFQPNDWQTNWCGPDSDLGSASPLLISPSLMFTAGKHGGGFLLDPTNLGGTDGQRFPTPKPAAYAQADVCFGNTSDATFGSFAYAAPFVYVECEGQGLVALNVNTSTPSFTPCDALCPAPNWNAGGTTTYGPPIVAGGAVWVASDGGGLSAFDATSGTPIYQSAGFGINRFSTPAEAGSQVFVASHTVIKSFTFVPAVPAAYYALPAARLMDTRSSGGPVGAGGSRNLTVTGIAPRAPAGATAVIMNVTVTGTTAASFLTVYPSGLARPLSSNLNWTAGRTVANLVEVPVGNGGAVTFYNRAGSTHVVVDLEGYFAAPSGTAGEEVGLVPARITDTRAGSGLPNAGATLAGGTSLDVQVTGAGNVPATGVSAVILNVTATHTTAAGFFTVWPTGLARPTASSLNWVAGQTVPNRVIVPIGSGKVSVYNGSSGTADLIIDVSGYFTDSSATGTLFIPQVPHRIADTRGNATLGPGGTFTLAVRGQFGVPSAAAAVILNVTATGTTRSGFLTVYPSTSLRPTASDLNWTAGLTVPNLVVATLGTTGSITFYNASGNTDVVVDLVGYFS